MVELDDPLLVGHKVHRTTCLILVPAFQRRSLLSFYGFLLVNIIEIATCAGVCEAATGADGVGWLLSVVHFLLGILANDCFVCNLVVDLFIKLTDYLGLFEVDQRSVVVECEPLLSRVVFLEEVGVSNSSKFGRWDATFPRESACHIEDILLLLGFLLVKKGRGVKTKLLHLPGPCGWHRC